MTSPIIISFYSGEERKKITLKEFIPHFKNLMLKKNQFPIFNFPFPNFPFPIPHSPFPIPHSPFPIPHSPFPIPHSPFPIPRFSFKSISHFQFPISHFQFPIPHFPFPVLVTSHLLFYHQLCSNMSRKMKVNSLDAIAYKLSTSRKLQQLIVVSNLVQHSWRFFMQLNYRGPADGWHWS